MAATDKLHKEASAEAQACRATFNSFVSGKADLLGENELVDAVTSGKVTLSNLPKYSLRKRLEAMPPATQEAFIGKTQKVRSEPGSEIKQLADQRNDSLWQKVVAEDGKKIRSMSNYRAIRDQAKG